MPTTTQTADATNARVTRADVAARLRLCRPDDLAAVLQAADLAPADPHDPAALAEQIVAALWSRTHTPLGNAVMPASLDRLVDRVARKTDTTLPQGDAWARLDALTRALLPGGRVTRLDAVRPETLDRLRKTLWPAWTGVAGGAGAAGSRLAALELLRRTTGPIWDLLPRVPTVGPVFAGIRKGATTIARVSAPVGIALALLSLNQTFGPEDDKALPLLLGVGLLLRDAPQVVEAVVVTTPAAAPA